MKAAFLGTPSAAVPCLAAVADVVDVTVVVTRPDRARGRGRKPGETAVKVAAREWGLRTAQPEGIADLERVLGQANVDVAIVVAYGMLLPTRVLTLAATGFLNVHFSLLPRWRGAAPVERAILEGDERTGVSLMLIDEGVDTGPIISVVETPIGADETGGSLTARLSYLGAELIDDALPGYLAGRRSPAHQLDAGRTLAPALLRDEAQLDGRRDPARPRIDAG
jgi:methionyl-tRNA formyltransferase